MIFIIRLFSSPTQLPYRTCNTSTQARINMEQTLIEQSLIQISRYRFSLVIAGLTKMLKQVNEIVSGRKYIRTPVVTEFPFSCSTNRRRVCVGMIRSDWDTTR